MFLPLAGVGLACASLAVALQAQGQKHYSLYRRTQLEQLNDLPSDPWESRRERLKVRLFGPNEEQRERIAALGRRRSALRQAWGAEARGRMGDVDCSLMRSSLRIDRYRKELDDLIREIAS